MRLDTLVSQVKAPGKFFWNSAITDFIYEHQKSIYEF